MPPKLKLSVLAKVKIVTDCGAIFPSKLKLNKNGTICLSEYSKLQNLNSILIF